MRGLQYGARRAGRFCLRHEQSFEPPATRWYAVPGSGPDRPGARGKPREVRDRQDCAAPGTTARFYFPGSQRDQVDALEVGDQRQSCTICCAECGISAAAACSAAKRRPRFYAGSRLRILSGAVRYFDALTNDSRLVVDTVRSAAQHGAVALNYVRLAEAKQCGNVWRCTLEDFESGTRIEVQTRTIVNATGPWSDKLPHSNTSLRLTKGVHLVVDRHRLAGAGRCGDGGG